MLGFDGICAYICGKDMRIREPFKKTFPLRVFGQDDFPLRGGRGVPPNSAKENSAEKQFFRSNNSFFAFFDAFIALFDQLYGLLAHF